MKPRRTRDRAGQRTAPTDAACTRRREPGPAGAARRRRPARRRVRVRSRWSGRAGSGAPGKATRADPAGAGGPTNPSDLLTGDWRPSVRSCLRSSWSSRIRPRAAAPTSASHRGPARGARTSPTATWTPVRHHDLHGRTPALLPTTPGTVNLAMTCTNVCCRRSGRWLRHQEFTTDFHRLRRVSRDTPRGCPKAHVCPLPERPNGPPRQPCRPRIPLARTPSIQMTTCQEILRCKV